MGIGSHQSSAAQSVEWLTPPYILKALGEFDLDPCAPAHRPWDMAHQHISLPQNGLAAAWNGRVWLNPPYGKYTGRWLRRLVEHGEGTALIFARTETKMFFEYIWEAADAILFLEGRPTFCRPDGIPGHTNSGGPVCLVAYGRDDALILQKCGLPGKFIALK